MFRCPYIFSPVAKVLGIFWTYLIKTEDTKIARGVYSGQPKFKGTVAFDYTFAKMLDCVGHCKRSLG